MMKQIEKNDISETLSYYDFEFNTKENDEITNNYMNLKRRRALAEIDNAEFSWFHIRACIVSGVGFYTDAYDLFVINLVSSMLGIVYFKNENSIVPLNIDIGLKSSAACGTLFGQLVFGLFADIYGRKKMYGLELSIMIFATIGSALSADAFAVSIWGELMFWRFILGIGIGGDYPLSAVITSEFATLKRRGAMMAAVFAMQGFGILSAAIVSVVILVIYQDRISKDLSYIDHVWRLVLGFGVVPAIVALYFRLTVPETPRFTMDVERNIHQAAFDIKTVLSKDKDDDDLVLDKNINSINSIVIGNDDNIKINVSSIKSDNYNNQNYNHNHRDHYNNNYNHHRSHSKRRKNRKFQNNNSLNRSVLVTDAPRANWKDFKEYFGQWKNAKILIGTSVSWFVLDVAFYGIGLNNSIILKAIKFAGHDNNDSPYEILWNMSVGNIIVTMLGTVPGYWFTVFLVDKWGRKTIQLLGFGVLTVLFIILGFFYHQILETSIPLFIIIFTLCQFFLNFGPNATTFIVPGEVFPTRYRTTGHGISAASGKFGAIIAQVGFIQLKDTGGSNAFVNRLIQLFSLFMFVGFFVTFLIPETKNMSLEELSQEDQGRFIRNKFKKLETYEKIEQFEKSEIQLDTIEDDNIIKEEEEISIERTKSTENMVTNSDDVDVDDVGESSNYVHIKKYKNNRNSL
ncbi:hypothetical protein Glove_187g118 [Diversispora epigaea]|uniref:Major facilitator superfamily (MFS) profile domain-containing protein n=1 Tax=Diversispora epigaea TaxID=1348612 RepID=A0A397IW84_9GLOM|nr:hypothetical protein Glove_187g118 [Diversispora epigaea]